jgi:carboxyl-terminal processing protease
MKRVLSVTAFMAVVLVPGCGIISLPTLDETIDALEDCSVNGKNRTVRDQLREDYLWYRELPDPDPASFASPEAYLEAVRYQVLDSGYSYIADRAENEALFSDSQFVGFGFQRTLAGPDDLRVTEVYAGSPAAEAGLQRGARLLEIDGKRVTDLLANDQVDEAIGPREAGLQRQIRFIDRSGTQRLVTMTKRVVTIPPVSVTRTYPVGNRTVGYVAFHNFVEPTRAALDDAFRRLRQDGANELVLDLRYNGGGRISVATHLAGLIGGERTRGQTFTRLVHNDKNSRSDFSETMTVPSQALGLSRLFVITTDNSASASELMINGLRPFMSVTTIGSRTFGKPVGQSPVDFCDKTLAAVTFFTRNSRGEGEYFDGLAADCPAPDDLTRDLGDALEGSLAEAFQYLRNGRGPSRSAGRPPTGSLIAPAAGGCS